LVILSSDERIEPVPRRIHWGSAFASFLLPGLGQALGGRPLRMLAVALMVSLWGWLGVQNMVFLPPGKTSLLLLLTAEMGARVAAAWDAGRLSPSEASTRLRCASVFALAVLYALIGYTVNLTMAQKHSWVRSFWIPSESMTPTLQIGDYIMVDCRARALHRGEVVVFSAPEDANVDLVKRVVALGGDTVAVRQGRLWLNGVAQTERYIKGPMLGEFPLHTVKPGCFFAMGDNRNNSQDSRYIGDIPSSNAVGKALWIFWSSSSQRMGTGL
jgi:signal peptidase I